MKYNRELLKYSLKSTLIEMVIRLEHELKMAERIILNQNKEIDRLNFELEKIK